jgi:hypothetical protein
MSTNNYIRIEEVSIDKFKVAEQDYESSEDIRKIGLFDSIRNAIEAAENHIRNSEYGVEYGIRFTGLESKDNEEF